jgi:hypothetical protein
MQVIQLENQLEILQRTRRETTLQHSWWEAQARRVGNWDLVPVEVLNGLNSSSHMLNVMRDEYEVLVRNVDSVEMLLEYCVELMGTL